MKEHVPMLSLLKKNYPSPSEVSREDLFKSLGWESLTNDPNYYNTCAIRMSLCLIRCGMILAAGGLKIQKGEHQGKRVEPSRAKLANYLKRVWGDPTFTETSAAKIQADIGMRGGVISFGPLPGYQGGHIDIIDGYVGVANATWHLIDIVTGASAENTFVCAGDCHWDAQDFWFWQATA